MPAMLERIFKPEYSTVTVVFVYYTLNYWKCLARFSPQNGHRTSQTQIFQKISSYCCAD